MRPVLKSTAIRLANTTATERIGNEWTNHAIAWYKHVSSVMEIPKIFIIGSQRELEAMGS